MTGQLEATMTSFGQTAAMSNISIKAPQNLFVPFNDVAPDSTLKLELTNQTLSVNQEFAVSTLSKAMVNGDPISVGLVGGSGQVRVIVTGFQFDYGSLFLTK